MKDKIFWWMVIVLLVTIVTALVYWCRAHTRQIQDLVIHLYIKIFCEK